jgi:hypothetical protein
MNSKKILKKNIYFSRKTIEENKETNAKSNINKNKTHKGINTETTNKCLIINSEDFIFDYKAYNKELLGEYLSKKDFQIIIAELNKVVTKAFIVNNNNEKIKIYKLNYILILISMIMFLGGILIIKKAENFHINHPNELNILYIICVLLTVGCSIILCGISIYNFSHTSIRLLTTEDMIHSFIKKYISFLNVYFKGTFKWTYFPKKSIITLEIEDQDYIDEDVNIEDENNNKVKSKEIKKLEELFEGFENEEDEMIEKKLFGDGWEEKNEYEIIDEDEETDLNNSNNKNKEDYKKKYIKMKSIGGNEIELNESINKENLRFIIENEDKYLYKANNSMIIDNIEDKELINFFGNINIKHNRNKSI